MNKTHIMLKERLNSRLLQILCSGRRRILSSTLSTYLQIQKVVNFFLKILLLNKITFSTVKKAMKIISVKTGRTGAKVARNMIGRPKTIAGKFW